MTPRGRSLCITFAMFVIQFSDKLQGQTSQLLDTSEVKREVVTSWRNRLTTIKSVTITSEIDDFIKGTGDKPAEMPGPFAVARSTNDRLSKVVVQYASENGKIGLKRSSDGAVVKVDPDTLRPQSVTQPSMGRQTLHYLRKAKCCQWGIANKLQRQLRR